MKYEHKYIVFDVKNGPKVVEENLNTNGNEGWQLATIIAVGNGEHLVAFLKREIDIKMPDPEKSKKESISKLWGGEEDD